MDSFKSLFEKKQYDLIIKLTQTSNNSEDYLYCVSAYVAKGLFNDAINMLETKKDVLEREKLPIYMKMYIDILCLLDKYDEAYEKVKYFENLPYFSQEAEEVLRGLNNIIKDSEISSFKRGNHRDDEDILNDLHSKDSLSVIDALNQIRERKIDEFILSILKIMTSFPKQSVRSIALLVLVEAKYDKEVKFFHLNKVITVIPSTLSSPFNDDFVAFSNSIAARYKDPSLSNVISKVLTTYIVYYYPDSIPEDDSFNAALFKVACSMLNSTCVLSNYNYDESLLDEYVSKIKLALEEE